MIAELRLLNQLIAVRAHLYRLPGGSKVIHLIQVFLAGLVPVPWLFSEVAKLKGARNALEAVLVCGEYGFRASGTEC